MKRLFQILALIVFAVTAAGADRVTVTLTITNNPSDGNTFVLNADTRTWKTTVATPATQVTVAAGTAENATNLLRHVSANAFSGPVIPLRYETNVLKFVGSVGQAMSASLTGTWGEISYSTQTVASVYAVRVPMASTVEFERTNNASLLVQGIGSYSLSSLDQNSTAAALLMGIGNTQTVTGPKTFTGATVLLAPTLSNAVNYGTAFSSPGSGTQSEEFGVSASASGTYATAVGRGAAAAGEAALAVGSGAIASIINSIAIGAGSESTGTNSIAFGTGAVAGYNNSIAIGTLSTAGHTNSVTIGTSSATTAANQIRLGSASHNVSVAGTITGTVTNSTFYGTVGTLTGGSWSSGGSTNTTSTNSVNYGIRFPRSTVSSLANGNNAGLSFGDFTYVKLTSGPTGAFAICGITGGTDGKLLVIVNRTGQAMTIANDSGVDATAANRIYTLTGGDIATTGDGAVTLIYDTADSRWNVLNYQP